MATKAYLELQGYSDEELRNELEEIEAQYQKLRFDHAIRGLDNPVSLRHIRRDVARIKTEIRKRELTGMSEEEIDNRSRIRQRRRKK